MVEEIWKHLMLPKRIGPRLSSEWHDIESKSAAVHDRVIQTREATVSEPNVDCVAIDEEIDKKDR